MANVLIADDHPMVRAGLRQLLEEDIGFTKIAEAASGNEALESLASGPCDVLILDINMPDCSGLEILRQVRVTYPQTKVLVLSVLPERQYAVNVLRAGASGYLSKDCAPRDLLVAARTLLQGRRYISAQTAERLASDMDGDSNVPPHSRLSQREFQIFKKIAGGCRVSDIAKELLLSVKTVSTYRTRILEKMDLKTNADLTAYALRLNQEPGEAAGAAPPGPQRSAAVCQ